MPFFGSMRGKLINSIVFLMKKRSVRRGSAAVLFFLLLTFLVTVDIVPSKVNLQPGEVSRETVRSPRTVVFEDRIKTEEKRKQAAESIPPQYSKKDEVESAVLKDIGTVIQRVGAVQQEAGTEEERAGKIAGIVPFTLSESTRRVLSRPDPESLAALAREVNTLVSGAMNSKNGVTSENIGSVTGEINERLSGTGLPKEYINLGQGLVKHFLRPNTFLDEEKTRLLKMAARESVPPEMVTIRKEEKILEPGDVVTAEHMQKLEALGLSRGGVPWRAIIGNAMLIALLMMVVLFYLYQQNREIYTNAGLLYLLGIVVVVILAVARGILSIELTRSPEFGELLGYMVPMGAAGMLIAILIDSRLAVLVVSVTSLLLALMAGGQVNFGVVGLVGGITGVYSVSKLSQREDLAKAGFYTSAANVAAILVMGIISNSSPALVVGSAFFLGITNGILSSILTNGSLPYLENAFGITSSVRLLELSQPSNPLLKKLLTEAPGTYHHSILVGNLAEAAAEAVGGESLLVRVGAYYHDIGKIKRPYFFIENQLSNDNPHDKIAPTLSTLILTSHVRDGLELAKEHKLPQAIMKIIEQHHGSSLVTYFYHKARENGGDNINEDEFRYEGPKPQTKEAAIVMLADSVEAAVRSMQNRTHGRIEGLVRKIMKDKLLDGQLDECDLTFKDLEKIAQAFLKVLSGIFHSRVEYPDLTKEMERRKSRHGGINKQSAGRGSA
ncbi:MAG: HDIG domain-containing protein [Peptococcaceae bacterium]|nr:HDIG domain-containing protein [Peptococcaceae bacterium]